MGFGRHLARFQQGNIYPCCSMNEEVRFGGGLSWNEEVVDEDFGEEEICSVGKHRGLGC